jgi:serine/threonine protein kinase
MQHTQNTLNAASLSPRIPGTVSVFAEQTVSVTNRTPGSALMGIWRLGQLLYTGPHSRLFEAQPADAEGSPRFDYVLRMVSTPRETREAAIAQLNRFAGAAASTSHPNLIVVLDASLHSSQPFLIMPRLTGATVADVMHGPAVQPLPVILWMVRQAAQGLAALHLASWIHGDVKPENLFVSKLGHVTVLDLGFARPMGTRSNGEFFGTPRYAAPELIDSGETTASAAADIFALGSVLLKLIAWTGPTVRNPESLGAVAELVSEMIATAPVDRPSAKDVASRLLRLEIETLGEHIQPESASLRRAG